MAASMHLHGSDVPRDDARLACAGNSMSSQLLMQETAVSVMGAVTV